MKLFFKLGKYKAIDELENIAEDVIPGEVSRQALLELEKMLPEFIKNKNVKELKFLGQYSSGEVKNQAISELGKMIPEFIRIKALKELKFLGLYACGETAKQTIKGLGKLNAASELGYITIFASSKETQEQAKIELNKIEDEKKMKTTVNEIKELVKELD